MSTNNDFDNRHDVYISIQFEMFGITRVPGDKIIEALRMLEVPGDIVVKAVDMETGDEIYKHEGVKRRL